MIGVVTATVASSLVNTIAQFGIALPVLLARAGTSFTWNNSDPIENTLYLRGRLRGTLRAWAEEALRDSGYRPAAHHLYLVSELENLSNGRYDRLMILMPPGSAKSTYASIIFPVWWFTQHPKSSVISASHSFSLAEHFSRRVRNLILEKERHLGFGVTEDQRSVDAWATTAGGAYLSVGVRGAVTGHRADLVIIDDPIKSQADAESVRQRNYIWEWFKSDITTRLKPGGRVVLIMTRWHPDDLSGQLLEQAKEEWRIVRLPALAEADDPLGRTAGTPLWPEWEDHGALLRKRELIGERAWSALFQQTPLPSGGRLFSIDRIALVQPTSETGTTVRAWDLAATITTGRNDPDWTVGVKFSRDDTGRYLILDVARIRGTPHQVEALILSTARSDGTKVIVAIPEDPGQAGKSQMSYLTKQLAGFHVIAARETGSKATRAMPLASQVEAGNISIVRADWNRNLLDELRDFPWGRKDDQVDALVRAFTTLTTRPRSPGSIAVSIFSR
jgi:predicted phage terminase large subunit-like protein